MDQGTCLQFDRFTLDLARAALRFDDKEIFPRPKAFGVLRHLALNAGRLVAKHELFETIWPDVEVTDDSLVQCIRELRQLLGDLEHRLIRTVTRRGYLLDADVKRLASATYAVALDFKPAPLTPSACNRFFSGVDAGRVAEIGHAKRLPLPRIEIDTPDADVPSAIRRFVGVWVSGKGFVGTNRQFMLIVSHVEKEGLAGGYTVRGPPAPNSRIQNPAEAVTFTAYIADGMLAYNNPRGSYRVWFSGGGKSLIFEQTYVTGHTTMVALDPVWTLVEAERAEALRALHRRSRRSPEATRGRTPLPSRE